jgi:cell division protein FtsB
MMRIATDKDAFGESPFQDIAGYGLLGLQKANMQKQLESLKKAQEILSNTIKDIPQDPEDYYNEIK